MEELQKDSKREWIRGTGKYLLLLLYFVSVYHMQVNVGFGILEPTRDLAEGGGTDEVSTDGAAFAAKTKPKGKIAIVSSFVSRDNDASVSKPYMDHLMNKACYADLWGYDFIFNTTWGFDKSLTAPLDINGRPQLNRWWLEHGTWHRVPHIMAAMDAGYEWVIYADIDWVVQEMHTPIESFLKEWELYGHEDVHVLVPDDADGNDLRVFSAFAVMIRNSHFGRRLLHNWNALAEGLCPKGNFHDGPRAYGWEDTDQPGIWYALAKTHSEFHSSETNITYEHICDETTGLLVTSRVLGPELNAYTAAVGVKKGSHAKHLEQVPKDQSILWSRRDPEGKNGLGVQMTYTWDPEKDSQFRHAFAIHKKIDLPPWIMRDLEQCRLRRGCDAKQIGPGDYYIGCNNTKSNGASPF